MKFFLISSAVYRRVILWSCSSIVLAGVDLHAPLAAAERDVDQGALVGHQRGERLHLVLAHVLAVPDAALGGELVLAVLDPPGGDDLIPLVGLDGELEVIDAVADLDLLEETFRVVQVPGGVVEIAGDIGEESLAFNAHTMIILSDDGKSGAI